MRPDGCPPPAPRLMADSGAAMIGAAVGVDHHSYIESASGINAGGRRAHRGDSRRAFILARLVAPLAGSIRLCDGAGTATWPPARRATSPR